MESSSLMLDLHPGEAVAIGEDGSVRVQLIHKSGQLARLRVIAPRDLPIQKQQESEVPTRAMRGTVRA